MTLTNLRKKDTIHTLINYIVPLWDCCVPGKREPTGCYATSVRRFSWIPGATVFSGQKINFNLDILPGYLDGAVENKGLVPNYIPVLANWVLCLDLWQKSWRSHFNGVSCCFTIITWLAWNSMIIMSIFWKPIIAWIQQLIIHWAKPATQSLISGILSDLTRSRANLVFENAMLRQQLIVLNRQVKRPQITNRDRFRLILLAHCTSFWKQALHIVQPDTLIRWHRELFRFYWRQKSKK